MKNFSKILFIAAISFMTSSCFLFQPTHERCPAYGEIIKSNNADDLKIDKIKDDQV